MARMAATWSLWYTVVDGWNRDTRYLLCNIPTLKLLTVHGIVSLSNPTVTQKS